MVGSRGCCWLPPLPPLDTRTHWGRLQAPQQQRAARMGRTRKCKEQHSRQETAATLPFPRQCPPLSHPVACRYGSSQKQNVSDGTRWDWLSDAVVLYTSHDLMGWRKRATVFTAGDVPAAVRQQLLAGANDPLRWA